MTPPMASRGFWACPNVLCFYGDDILLWGCDPYLRPYFPGQGEGGRPNPGQGEGGRPNPAPEEEDEEEYEDDEEEDKEDEEEYEDEEDEDSEEIE